MEPRSPFRRRLAAAHARHSVDLAARGGRQWWFVPYDQLNDRLGPLARIPPNELGIVLIEAPSKAARRPYHRQKLAWVLANLRHFGLEQAERGVAVHHAVARGSYGEALAEIASLRGPIQMQEAAERELREDLAPFVASGALQVVAHEGWLTTPEQFRASQTGPPWRMDAFYRDVRRASGYLMDARGKPLGGKFSFDAENRKPWRGEPEAPEPPRFDPDEVVREVGARIEERFSHHPGTLDLGAIAATAADAKRHWEWARSECLPQFGPYEDAMSRRSSGLFHTRIAPLLNLGRLLARDVVEDVAREERVPLASREGFVRQILGWREFVRHVHRETDGFRGLGSDSPSFLGAHDRLPPAFWGTASGLACLDGVVTDVWREGWSHHITRLMVLGNIATLLDVEPRELADWFWAAYIDAFDWVVEPNVLAMATYGVGDLMTTKPYVAGAAYLDRLSDSCGHCAFDPKTSCPLTPLYWAFLERHRERLRGNPRLGVVLKALGARSEEKKSRDRAVFAEVAATLAQGRALAPENLPSALRLPPSSVE